MKIINLLKPSIFSFLFSLFLLFIFFSSYSQITISEAETAAKSFYKHNNPRKNANISASRILHANNTETIAMFSFEQDGFIAISLEYNYTPIIAYSFYGMHNLQNFPNNALYWLNQVSEDIAYSKEKQTTNNIAQKEWIDLLFSEPSNFSKIKSSPLLSTIWGQACYYNELCPEDNNGPCGHTVTGCVATAVAQIMKYWSHPQIGTGSHSYNSFLYGELSADFANTNYLWSDMPEQVLINNNAVATLMYHVGVAYEMQYTATSSGAHISSNPLVNFFDYSPNGQYVVKSNYSNQEWINLLKNQIDNGMPLLYAGFSNIIPEDGHAWVCDGYDDNDYLHFNWGWDGTANAYFLMGDFIYSNQNMAVINIFPTAICDVSIGDMISPPNMTFSQEVPISILVNNFSNENLSNIPVSYSVNGNLIAEEIITETIEAYSSLIYEFNQTYDFSQIPGGTFHIEFNSQLDCDEYADNNKFVTELINVLCSDIPYDINFTHGEDINGWLTEDANQDGNTWRIMEYNNEGVYYTSNENIADDWMFSKCINLEQNKLYKISFTYKSTGTYWYHNLKLHIGNAPESIQMNSELIRIDNINNNEPQEAFAIFTVQETSDYYFGWHCFSQANNLAIELGNISIVELNETDIMVKAIISPQSDCELGIEYISVELQNLCSQLLYEIPINYSINNGETISQTYLESIAPGEIVLFSFDIPADFSEYEIYTLKVWTSLDDDYDNTNDTLYSLVENRNAAFVVYPDNTFTQGFDNAESLAGWTIENTNQDDRYWKFFPSSGNIENGCMRYEYSDFNAADDWFFTKCIYLEPFPAKYSLVFYHKIESSQWVENLSISIGMAANSSQMIQQIFDLPGLTNETWIMAETDFSVQEYGFYYIGFLCYSNVQMFNLYIDDIEIRQTQTVNLPDFPINDFVLPETDAWMEDNFPDPFFKATLINYYLPENSEGRIMIYDMLGRNIASYQLQQGEHTLQIMPDNWISGIYNCIMIIDGVKVDEIKMVFQQN